MTSAREIVAFVHPKPVGPGGLGRLALDVLHGLVADGAEVHAFGPPTSAAVKATLPGVRWHETTLDVPGWQRRFGPMRWWTGMVPLRQGELVGRWAAAEVAKLHPDRCYLFVEVALETLRWARAHGVPCVVDNATGDVRHFRDAGVRETRRWLGAGFRAHPSAAMVRRTVEEYALADAVRVASTFSRESMIARGVPAEKVAVVRYPVDVTRFVPPAARPPAEGPLRVCYVAGIALAKGFQYVLEAARQVGPDALSLELVGGTDSRGSRRLLDRLVAGLQLRTGPLADVQEGLHRAELFVLPTLHDGWGFVVVEAMACGLPVIVTDACGARDVVEPGRTGWIVPAGDSRALAAALEEARRDRARLAAMGDAAREAVLARAREWEDAFARWWATEAPGRRSVAAASVS